MTSLPKPAMFNLVHILTGMRRSGKTNARTQKREITALEQTMHRMSDVTGTIITLREEGTIPTDTGDINVIPAWKWALQSKN